MKKNFIHSFIHKKYAKNRAFTLVEILVAVIIVGILAGLLVVSTSAPLEKSEEVVCQANRRTLLSAFNVERAASAASKTTTEILQSAIDNCDIGNRVTFSVSDNSAAIDGLCQSGGTIGLHWYLVDGAEKKWILCTKHIDEDVDPSARYRFETSWLSFLAANLPYTGLANQNAISQWKAKLYEDYYAANPPIQMAQDYYETYIQNSGLYRGPSLSALYWWNYPVTDNSGKILYTVTFANEQSDVNQWPANSTPIRRGYVVVVDGITYVRNKYACISPADPTQPYKTKEALIAALDTAGYEKLGQLP
ncbi:MAG: type II secretion system protein [Synergistaceae bacterium]|nr:type II secretion system protein [Synergistaceae bacterium]